MNTLQQVQKVLQNYTNISCQLFSAHTDIGLSEARKQILEWLSIS